MQVTIGGGLARHVDQDGGGRAAVLRAVEDAGQHDQRRGRRQPKVNGSSIAIVVSGAMPGSTPTSVPIMTPAKQNSRFCQRCGGGEAQRQIVEQLHASPHQGQNCGQAGRAGRDP